ncbi:MAG: flagellar hook assembly protein FlgD [Proteobacteria bacterium]|nr:flagellar hook assembly protein FlgD [Pseudomonadota bacterium]
MALTVSQTPASITASQSTLSNGTIAQNFETFLNLLTTQLRNQSPLDPLNTNEFTQQLVQFASVEQQMKSNDNLNALLTTMRANNVTNALGFVGARVTASGNTTELASGKAEWRLDVPRSAASATFTVTDKTGATVFSETRALAAGSQPYTWSGALLAGGIAPDGEYTLNVSAKDAAGQTITIGTDVTGTVESVDITGSEPILTIGSLIIPASKVKTIQK